MSSVPGIRTRHFARACRSGPAATPSCNVGHSGRVITQFQPLRRQHQTGRSKPTYLCCTVVAYRESQQGYADATARLLGTFVSIYHTAAQEDGPQRLTLSSLMLPAGAPSSQFSVVNIMVSISIVCALPYFFGSSAEQFTAVVILSPPVPLILSPSHIILHQMRDAAKIGPAHPPYDPCQRPRR